MKRKICVVTGSRADYGLLYWLLREIRGDKALRLQLAVTGMHLSAEFGNTYREILKDGFRIDAKVNTLTGDNSVVGVSRSLAKGIEGFAKALGRLRPDAVLVLGDRYEIFAAAQAAMIANIPLAHIHGGERTEGAFDEAIRHAISKMAHFHFTASKTYARRVAQLGEPKESIFAYGAPGLDHLVRLRYLKKNELEHALNFKLKNPLFLVTYHPVTRAGNVSAKAISALFQALDRFDKACIVFTKANADPGGSAYNRAIDTYVRRRAQTAIFTSLGRVKYLSLMKLADVVIGNSSSGIIEAPALCVPTVNIGERQRGRCMSASVVQSRDSAQDISKAIRLATSKKFRSTARVFQALYGRGGYISRRIKDVLKRANFKQGLMKEFCDLS